MNYLKPIKYILHTSFPLLQMLSRTDIAFLEFAIRTTQSSIHRYEQKVAQRVNVGYYRQELAGLYDRIREYKQILYSGSY